MKAVARLKKGRGVCHPTLFVKVNREEPTSFVREQRIYSDSVFPCEVLPNHLFRQGEKDACLSSDALAFFWPGGIYCPPIHGGSW